MNNDALCHRNPNAIRKAFQGVWKLFDGTRSGFPSSALEIIGDPSTIANAFERSLEELKLDSLQNPTGPSIIL